MLFVRDPNEQRSNTGHGRRNNIEDLDSEQKTIVKRARKRRKKNGESEREVSRGRAGGQRKPERKSKRRREIEEWVGGRTSETRIKLEHMPKPIKLTYCK